MWPCFHFGTKTESRSRVFGFWFRIMVINTPVDESFVVYIWFDIWSKLEVFLITFYYYLDNDKPVLTTSVVSPVEGIHNVTLTCTAMTSDNVTGYTYFRNNVQISVRSSNSYTLSNNSRVDDGNYTCEVTTSKAPRSPKADPVAVMFLCKLPSNRKSGIELSLCLQMRTITLFFISWVYVSTLKMHVCPFSMD